MAFARPYSQAERDLALAKMNATQPQVPVQPAPRPMPTPMNPLGQAQFGQYSDYSAPWGAPTAVQGSPVGPMAGPATNPLMGVLDERMQSTRDQLAAIIARQQAAQAQQGQNYQSYQTLLAQPGPQMSLPDRQAPDLGGQAASGALQFLAALAGARPQYIQPMQAVATQQQHNRDQGFQDEHMRRQFQYQADVQRRQDQEWAAQAGIAATSEELRSLGAMVPKTEAELNDLTMKSEDLKAKAALEATKQAAHERQLKMRLASQETVKWMGSKAGQYSQALDFVASQHPDWSDDEIESEARTISGVSLVEAREAEYKSKTAKRDSEREVDLKTKQADLQKKLTDNEYLPKKYKAQIESLRASAAKSRSGGAGGGKASASSLSQSRMIRSKLLTSAEGDLRAAKSAEERARKAFEEADADLKAKPRDKSLFDARERAADAYQNAMRHTFDTQNDRDVVKRELADLDSTQAGTPFVPPNLQGIINGARMGGGR